MSIKTFHIPQRPDILRGAWNHFFPIFLCKWIDDRETWVGELFHSDTNFEESSKRKKQVKLHFNCIVSMEEVDISSITPDDSIKRLVKKIVKTKDIMRESRDRIANGFKGLRD